MFDTDRFLRDHWPTARKMEQFLTVYGYSASYMMVYQWYTRKRVPAEWGLTLAALLEVETGHLSIAKYLK